MVCVDNQNIRPPAPPAHPAPTASLRERVRRWLVHRPGLGGHYEGYRPDFSDPASPRAIHENTGAVITFTRREVFG